ncbi:hypothetical protein BBC27_12035 [Acidithiobacillus ferrivorans]|uniref:Uncharacterized protein n=1 Tax=Acidithiobacillus ferrivorans TaxID=160808 RepID=A0A1B9BY53_9PROT|nr:hypothetical protein [Acidithiobacillus ferrivorans]OCB02646.1 hypothetical protein BBC27_12035 [Acidithiobacillus ferrivorans]
MTSLTINDSSIEDLLSQAKKDFWFAPGNEDLRLDAATWLAKPTAIVPKFFSMIANGFCLPLSYAITLGRVIDDTDVTRLDRSKSFKALPISALEIWEKSRMLFQELLHNPDSSGAAHSKLMSGQYLKSGAHKDGLIDLFHGDRFLAHAAHYATFGGMNAVRNVQRCMGWSADKIRDMVLTVVKASHQLLKEIGKNGLKWLAKAASAGLGFFPMLFSILHGKTKAVAAMKMEIGAAKKATKATKSPTLKIAAAKNMGNEDDDDNGDDAEQTDAHDDADDYIDSDAEETEHVAADGPPDDVFLDDSDNPDDPDDPEAHDPGTRLKMGRELAYELLRQSRNNPGTSQRHRLIMDSVDERILLNAMQKDLRPTDLAVAERMTNFLSFCWQWAERTGIFREPDHQEKLDMPITQVIRQVIHAVQKGYWETGDNKPVNNSKIWISVTHADRNGRPRMLTVTRPISQLQMKPSGFKGRMIVIKPDAALRECFFQQIPDSQRPSEKNTRYFIVRNEGLETITAQRYIHPRGTALSGARSIDDLEDGGQWQPTNVDDTAATFDFPDEDEATIQLIADLTDADKDLIQRSLDGDDRAREILAHTCQALPEDRKAMIEDTFSHCKKEAEADDDAEVPPALLDQGTRRDLARMLNLDLGTLEKAFQDDSDSIRALKRAIKNMPEHLRNQAIRKIHLAAKR